MGIKARRRPRLDGFIGGVLVSQVANNALHLAQPLLVYRLSGSLGFAALFSSVDTALHMGSTFVAGWPADRLGSRRLLVLATAGRAAALAAIPLAWAAGRLTLPLAVAAYSADALVRGFVDTSAHALPLELSGNDPEGLDAVNFRYEAAFDCGAVVGPLLLGALLLKSRALLASALIPAGLAAGALAFLAIPRSRAAPRPRPEGRGPAEGLRRVLKNGALLWPCAGLAALNLYPLRKLVAAFFAKALLKQAAAAGWLGAAFGLGGIAGSALYGWRGRKLGDRTWLAAGVLGAAALAGGCLTASLVPMLAAAFVFSLTNAGARLAVTRRLQESTPVELAGGVTAVARFSSNAVSVALKTMMAAAFSLGATPAGSFVWLAGGLGAVALLQAGLIGPVTACHEPVTSGLQSSYSGDAISTLE